MRAYLDLLQDILDHGTRKRQRAKIGDGMRSVHTLAVFGRQIRFDLSAGFPLVTTKRVPFNWVREELLWFLSGSTNNNDLKARGVTIWDEWADPVTGELGPIYGQQWRRWESAHRPPKDQIAYLLDGIRAVIADPEASSGRRLILSAWNAADIELAKGPMACHTLAQFDVTASRLSCQLYQRSADMFLGVPFNIASYAMLTHLLAHLTGLRVGEYVHTFGDAHIYENHLDQVREQLTREPFPLPTLRIDPGVKSIDGIASDQITILNYRHHPALPADVAV